MDDIKDPATVKRIITSVVISNYIIISVLLTFYHQACIGTVAYIDDLEAHD